MEVQHAFWTEKRTANFGFISTFPVTLRFETVVNDSGALCYRISTAFDDSSGFFTTVLPAADCTKYVKETNEFSQRLHELVLDTNSIMDLVMLNDVRLILSVRAINVDTHPELRWFSSIITRASPVEQSLHLRMLLTQCQNELATERNEVNQLRAENRLLQTQLKSLEETSSLVKRTVDKTIRLISSSDSLSVPVSSSIDDEVQNDEEEDSNLPDSIADKSTSASPDLRIGNTSTSNQELLLGIASYLLCAVCEKVSVPIQDSNELSRHFINEHVDDAKRQCLACPDANIFDLVSHIKTHTHRVYACEFCGKKGRKHYLKSHVRTHTKERPFKCSTCGRSFADQSTIRRHQSTVHSVEKKFTCNICGHNISRKDNYRVHLKSHSAAISATISTSTVNEDENMKSNQTQELKHSTSQVACPADRTKGSTVPSEVLEKTTSTNTKDVKLDEMEIIALN
ncbi:hypothetical protein M3Y98_00449000 [Aphelenchoides besseyi]|nr:hypothetical protein M3Y98_00449000 [Aphelenchoides besseyi]KAI6207370.1 hypothetical protein M3Y96_00002000 [Aphelenchoides besseyi]